MLWKVEAQRGIQVLGNIGCCVGVVEHFLDRRADPLEGPGRVIELRARRCRPDTCFVAQRLGRVTDDVRNDVPSEPPVTGRRTCPSFRQGSR
jgi:hypothetical protein